MLKNASQLFQKESLLLKTQALERRISKMNSIELKNRKYTLIEEIMRIESDSVIEKIEKFIQEENQRKKSPLSYTIEELKQEVAEAEKESDSNTQEEVKAMSWKK